MWCGDFGSSIVCVHQRGRRRLVAKSTTKQILHAMALTPLSLAPCAVHVLATEPGDEGGMMAKRVVVDDACLPTGGRHAGLRRRSPPVAEGDKPGTTRGRNGQSSVLRAVSVSQPASHPSVSSMTEPAGLCSE